MVHHELLDQAGDEILEQIWCRREVEDEGLAALLAKSREPDALEVVERLRDEGFLGLDGDALTFTEAGERRAREIVRRHRLTERLLSDVLDRPLEASEHEACLLEHVLSSALTDAVCTFLGHPPTCPHGLPIPRGACCAARRNDVSPVVGPLPELEPGASARIVFMTPSFHRRMTRLENFGVVPGTVLSLRQKRPSLVVEIGGTTLALEAEVASEIYVKRVS